MRVIPRRIWATRIIRKREWLRVDNRSCRSDLVLLQFRFRTRVKTAAPELRQHHARRM